MENTTTTCLLSSGHGSFASDLAPLLPSPLQLALATLPGPAWTPFPRAFFFALCKRARWKARLALSIDSDVLLHTGRTGTVKEEKWEK